MRPEKENPTGASGVKSERGLDTAEILSAYTENAAESQALCSGNGQYHSPNNKICPQPFITVALPEIRAMLEDPPSTAKEKAQWFIPSTLMSRVHAEQLKDGLFYALWFDFDEVDGWTFDDIVSRACFFLPDFFAYTSRGATEQKQKTRIIVPLTEPVTGELFTILQKIGNDKFEAEGVKPDRANERPGQVCYLPNRGEYYRYYIEDEPRGNRLTDLWAEEIKQEYARIKAEAEAAESRREQARLKVMQRKETGSLSPIEAFNAAFSPPDMLERYGAVRCSGGRWLSPNSESGNAAITITKDGKKWLSAHGSDAGIGKPTKNGTIGDAFDLFVYYEHNGDRDAAIKAAGEMFTVNGDTLTKANQREYMRSQSDQEPPPGFDDIPPIGEPAPKDNGFSIYSFVMNGDVEGMEAKMLDDKFVLGRLAILGQSAVFYSKPNVGKTLLVLWLLIEKINQGEVDGKDVFYVNADDNYKGLIHKGKLAVKHGFMMLAPGHKGFKADQLPRYLEKMIQAGDVSGKIFILDTVKKFTDLMSKDKASKFGESVRRFISHGGTVIMLAHVNKWRDENGKVVYSGTTDLVDDADCAYTIDVLVEEGGLRTVKFENFKSRGDVTRKAFYRYDCEDGTPYYARLESVEEVDQDEQARAEKQKLLDDRLRKNQKAVDVIVECIRDGITQKTALINEAQERSGASKKYIRDALQAHTGFNVSDNQFWRVNVQDNNAHVYELNS